MGNEGDPRAPIDVQGVARNVAASLGNKGKYVPPLENIVEVVSKISDGAKVTIYVSNIAEKTVKEQYPNPHGNISDGIESSGNVVFPGNSGSTNSPSLLHQ